MVWRETAHADFSLRIHAAMPRSRPQKTLADYLAIGVTPLLIMLLVGSLVFFLQSLFYSGGHGHRVLWILFWFVIGAVLVARIAMESGRAYASAFTLALAAATSLAMFRFSDAPLVPIVCLGIIWWCADKLTWDCTLIDDSEDASGEGLLQVAGVADEAEISDEVTGQSGAGEASSDAAEERIPLWRRLFLNEAERKGKPHAPGLWVVYFSLAALPLFGFGQTMLPPGDQARRFAFLCLFTYVASALGLLMLTSFLGLRRYLRQRNMQMPTSMALTWVGMGSAIAVGILIACLVLPRPEGEYDVTAMVDRAGEEVQEAADWAFGDSSGEGDGERSGEADEDATEGAASDPDQQGRSGGTEGQREGESRNAKDGKDGSQKGGEESGNRSGEGEQRPGESQENGDSGKPEEGDRNGQGEQVAENENSDKGNPSGQAGDPSGEKNSREPSGSEGDPAGNGEQVAENTGENPPPDESAEADAATPESPESPDLSSALSQVGNLFKWLVYGIAGLVAAFLIYRHRLAIWSFLQNLWAEFLSIFGRQPETDTQGDAVEEPAVAVRPFAAFSNPFQSGAARKKTPSELVRYSFEALQAWAIENGCPRDPHQTPSEFGTQLKKRNVSCAVEGQEVSQLYAQIAYADYRPGAESLPVLEKLWRKMSAG